MKFFHCPLSKESAYQLLAHLPPLNFFKGPKQWVAFMGLCPMQKQLGMWQGKSCLSKRGNVRLRKALYVPALSIKQFNDDFAPFIERLQSRSMKGKPVICAIMRKLAHIVFGILRNNHPYNPALVGSVTD